MPRIISDQIEIRSGTWQSYKLGLGKRMIQPRPEPNKLDSGSDFEFAPLSASQLRSPLLSQIQGEQVLRIHPGSDPRQVIPLGSVRKAYKMAPLVNHCRRSRVRCSTCHSRPGQSSVAMKFVPRLERVEWERFTSLTIANFIDPSP